MREKYIFFYCVFKYLHNLYVQKIDMSANVRALLLTEDSVSV
jgi:hypothetical protein